jgi:hypothetical protein
MKKIHHRFWANWTETLSLTACVTAMLFANRQKLFLKPCLGKVKKNYLTKTLLSTSCLKANQYMWPLYQSRNNHLHSVFRHTGVAHTDDNASREQGLTGRTQKYAACTRRWTGTVSGREYPTPLGRWHNNIPQPDVPPPFHMHTENELLNLTSELNSKVLERGHADSYLEI